MTGVEKVGADLRGVPKLNQQQLQGRERKDLWVFFILDIKKWNSGSVSIDPYIEGTGISRDPILDFISFSFVSG